MCRTHVRATIGRVSASWDSCSVTHNPLEPTATSVSTSGSVPNEESHTAGLENTGTGTARDACTWQIEHMMLLCSHQQCNPRYTSQAFVVDPDGILETEYFLTTPTEQYCRRAEISGFRDLGLRSRELYMLLRAGLLFSVATLRSAVLVGAVMLGLGSRVYTAAHASRYSSTWACSCHAELRSFGMRCIVSNWSRHHL